MKYSITSKIKIRKRYKEETGKKAMSGNSTGFKGEYVEWLERQILEAEEKHKKEL